MVNREGSKERFKKTRCLYYKQTLICCLGVCVQFCLMFIELLLLV